MQAFVDERERAEVASVGTGQVDYVPLMKGDKRRESVGGEESKDDVEAEAGIETARTVTRESKR